MGITQVLHDLDLKLYAFDRMVCGRWWNYVGVVSPFARIFYVLDGSAQVSFRGGHHPLRPGRLVLTPPFVPVDYRCNGRFDGYYALLTCRTRTGLDFFSFGSMHADVPEDALTAGLFRRLHELNPDRGLVQVDPHRPGYDRAVWDADPDRIMPPEAILASDGILRVLLSRFIVDLPLNGGTASRFLPVIAHIERHLRERLTLTHLAAVARLRPTHFSDMFRAEVGVRPIAYLTRRRLDHAQLLLLSTNRSMKEVAVACGFPDANYFSRVFQRQVGMTPSAYRQRGL
jgi:AraC-like DNA-binding protein